MTPVNFSVTAENHAKPKIYTPTRETIKDVLSEFVEQLPGYF
ncbi:Uncharacterised protein [Yersinia intermedia]|jgi:hypothetical protein|uniref:Uncharacterized protein n=1 Tax=Yersinia intermedia TaxID=631 RepID=A0A0T9MX85_YERIN|nr:hypothetical protein CH53_100 [Yersinia intermedia]CND55995.1 Uncharacterised protein [Yersinia intermedia]CNG57096.1 Uncharacterised protein [Yersinia intermedia]CNH10622.1 Uncharacterised protein [Yersinia intermedia]CNJ56639.1 Uncharacterised protein [Yersinia intermedia]